MRAEYDFSKGKHRASIPTKGKTRITIYIDDAVLDKFLTRAEKAGTGYQTMMNERSRPTWPIARKNRSPSQSCDGSFGKSYLKLRRQQPAPADAQRRRVVDCVKKSAGLCRDRRGCRAA